MRTRTTTLKDVAAAAGVSDATASAVLSNSRGNNVRVSEPTRQRIQEAARLLRYQAHAPARSLRRRRTDIIGLYGGHGCIPTIIHPVAAALVGGIHYRCAEQGRNLLLYSDFGSRTPEATYSQLVSGQVDGLLLNTYPADELIPLLTDAPIPVISVVDALPGIASVTADDRGGARMLVEYLAARGHTRLMFGQPVERGISVMRRREGCREAAAALGLTLEETPEISYGPQGYEIPDAAFSWLDRPRDARPTALIGAFDEIANLFVFECLRRGLRMPDDLAVVGFDGVVPAQPGAPRLTTICAHWQSVGQTAMTLLEQRLNGDAVPDETLIGVTLMEGDTA